MKKIKVVDLFSGVGGLSFGFAHDDSFEIVAANEILKNMAIAYQLNHPTVKMYNKDIKFFGINDLQKDFNITSGDIDIVVGGPPCQAYSTLGKRLIDDPRAFLFQEYFRIISELSPKLFLFENVRGLISMNNGLLLQEIIELFKTIGYNVTYQVLNAADYGVPQHRERVIIIGSLTSKQFIFPEATHCHPDNKFSLFNQDKLPYVTLGEAISDLPFINSGETAFDYSSPPNNQYQKWMRVNAPEKIMDHSAPKNNPTLVALMECLPDGGTPLDLPEEMRPTSGYANTYSRLWWDKPSTTITRNLSTPSSSRCVHPKVARPLTTREGARLQSFPDSYIFYGSRSDKNLQIGNAVPAFLSFALKESIKEFFQLNNWAEADLLLDMTSK